MGPMRAFGPVLAAVGVAPSSANSPLPGPGGRVILTVSGAIGNGTVPGPLTARLMEAYKQEVETDYVAQYLRHLD